MEIMKLVTNRAVDLRAAAGCLAVVNHNAVYREVLDALSGSTPSELPLPPAPDVAGDQSLGAVPGEEGKDEEEEQEEEETDEDEEEEEEEE